MLKAGDCIFVQPVAATDALRRGVVAAASPSSWTVELEDPFEVDPGQQLLVFYDDLRMFVQRSVRVAGVEHATPECRLELQAAGQPVRAERRAVARICAAGSDLLASLAGSDFCTVLELSPRGFAVLGSFDLEVGAEVEAVLLHGRDDLGGRVCVRDVRKLEDGQRRYGVVCVDGLLKFALASVNLAVQRDHLRRLWDRKERDCDSWSVPAEPRIDLAQEPARKDRAPGRRPRLRMEFSSLLAFERELQRSVAEGGMFIPTDQVPEIGTRLEVEFDLEFCQHRIVLEARVQRVTAPGGDGAVAGIGVAFVDSPSALQHLMAEVAGAEGHESGESWPRLERPFARHRRTQTRIAAIVGFRGETRPAHTRNLSRSGALLVADGEAIPIGAEIVLTLVEPHRGESVRLAARVARHVAREGRVTSMGVRFEADPEQAPALAAFLDRLPQGSDPQQTGRIGGTLAPLGLANLLQMLSVCVERGTITLHSHGASARIAFEDGALRSCRAGAVSGLKALARVLEWADGQFEFVPHLPAEEPDGVRVPIANALLECTHQVDELHRIKSYPLPPEARFEQLSEREAETSSEREVLACIRAGSRVREIMNHFPVYDTEVYRVLERLLAEQVVALRS